MYKLFELNIFIPFVILEPSDNLPKVRFSQVVLEHSTSIPEDSWHDSSLEDSFRTQLACNDKHAVDAVSKDSKPNKKEKHLENKSTKVDESKYHPLEKFRHLKASTEKLFHSSRDEEKKTKAILGAVGGLLIGIVLFLLAVFSFDYTYVEAGVSVSIITILIMLGLALSVHCRCIMVLIFPSFLTGRGRTLMLSVLFSLMLTHPFSNIVYNTKETGNSMACIVELAANQSRQLQQQLIVPYQEMSGTELAHNLLWF